MSKTWTQRVLLNWRWWVSLVPMVPLFIAVVAFVGVPWGLWCAVKAFAEEWLDPPFPEVEWIRKLGKWVREGVRG